MKKSPHHKKKIEGEKEREKVKEKVALTVLGKWILVKKSRSRYLVKRNLCKRGSGEL